MLVKGGPNQEVNLHFIVTIVEKNRLCNNGIE